MILDALPHASTYFSLGDRFQAAFDYLATFDPSTPDGRHDLDGDNLYALVQTYESEASGQRTFESHRACVDIQYIFSGREIIFYGLSERMSPEAPYDPSRDVTFYEDSAEARPIHLAKGDFVVLWPQDAHKPGCLWETPVSVRKVVMKIRLSAP
jgi:biofilm protein TabA